MIEFKFEIKVTATGREDQIRNRLIGTDLLEECEVSHLSHDFFNLEYHDNCYNSEEIEETERALIQKIKESSFVQWIEGEFAVITERENA